MQGSVTTKVIVCQVPAGLEVQAGILSACGKGELRQSCLKATLRWNYAALGLIQYDNRERCSLVVAEVKQLPGWSRYLGARGES